jgi:hypothetical protein
LNSTTTSAFAQKNIRIFNKNGVSLTMGHSYISL